PWLRGASVAALPESLPSSLHIWFFTFDSTLVARLVPIRFDFGQRGEVSVPISKRGDECGLNTPVVYRKMPVVWVTVTYEATRQTVPVLASKPHMRVNP